jgi:Sulfatase
MKRPLRREMLGFALGMASAAIVGAQTLDRTSLPIHEPEVPKSAVVDVRNATAPPRFQVKAPEGSPNVVIVLIDDMGFGQSSTFGGPLHMPTLERLAASGLRYNQFHTTALCSPTRAALLTGRNHHTTNLCVETVVLAKVLGPRGQRSLVASVDDQFPNLDGLPVSRGRGP